MNIGELFVQIGAIGNSKEVKAFGEAVKKAGKAIDDFDKKQAKTETGSGKLNASLGSAVMKFVGIAGAVAGAYFALDRLTESLAKQNQQWLLFANQSDVAMSTLQKWDTIGKIAGIDGVGAQIQSLEQKIFNLRLTGEGAKGFQMAGIMPTNAGDVMEQLRHRVSGMNNASASFLLQQMGLDPKMLTMLRMTREEWEKYVEIQRRFTLTKRQREEIERMNRQLQIARIKIQYLKDRAIMAIMPLFLKLTNIIATLSVRFGEAVNWIIKADNPLAKMIKGVLILVTALKGLNLVMGLIQKHPLIMLFSTLILIFDDLIAYFTGRDSLIGVIMNGLKDLDIKGYIDFETPDWINKLIEIIHTFKKRPFTASFEGIGKSGWNLGEKAADWVLGKLGINSNPSGGTVNNVEVHIVTNSPVEDMQRIIYALPNKQ